MLYTNTVERKTFELLITLMHDDKLAGFNLAGGTSLALYLGHRLSIDLDLFCPDPFDAKALEIYLIDKYNFHSDYLHGNALKGTINGIKIDCITHHYPYIENTFISEDGIRLYSLPDVVAMKLSAIADNGTRVKDFIDIAYLSTKLPLSAMLGAYEAKFKNTNAMRALKALTFFQDINMNEPIRMLHNVYDWTKIETRLFEMVNEQNKVFTSYP